MLPILFTNKKIILLVPGPSASGGITNYYTCLRHYLSPSFMFLIRGARDWPYRASKFREMLRIISDYLTFFRVVRKIKTGVVVTSTSLGKSALLRDAIFLVIARSYGLKTVVFFRGWNPLNEKFLIEKFWYTKIYKSVDLILVLSSYVEATLRQLQFHNSIIRETTLFDVNLVENYCEHNIYSKFEAKDIKFLFLARIEKEKGIFETLEIFRILAEKYKKFQFLIAGKGRAEADLKLKIASLNNSQIKYLGFVEGQNKANLLKASNFFVFPSYTEGMPNSVLEAMAFGHLIITRDVGALPDLIDDNNGFITSSFDPLVFVQAIENLLKDKTKMTEMAIHNHLYAMKHFASDKVAKRITDILEAI